MIYVHLSDVPFIPSISSPSVPESKGEKTLHVEFYTHLLEGNVL